MCVLQKLFINFQRFFSPSLVTNYMGNYSKPWQSVFQGQPTALLRASGSMQGRYMALSVVYFQFTHHLGRPHYVWDEYLYSVLEEVEVRMTVCVTFV